MIGQNPFNWVPTHPKITNNRFIMKAETEAELLAGWVQDNEWTLRSIQLQCPDIGANEVCVGTPFKEFTIRGTQGSSMDDDRWWWVSDNELGLTNYDGGDDDSGAAEIHVREGYQVKIKVRFETEGQYKFMSDIFSQITTDSSGILEVGSDYFIALMGGGDQLSVDIDSDWGDTSRFYLKTQGKVVANSTDKSIDDEVYIALMGVYVEEGSDNEDCSATNNKVLSDNGDCSCKPGYTIDENDATGPCVKDNTMLYVGIGGAILVGLLLFRK